MCTACNSCAATVVQCLLCNGCCAVILYRARVGPLGLGLAVDGAEQQLVRLRLKYKSYWKIGTAMRTVHTDSWDGAPIPLCAVVMVPSPSSSAVRSAGSWQAPQGARRACSASPRATCRRACQHVQTCALMVYGHVDSRVRQRARVHFRLRSRHLLGGVRAWPDHPARRAPPRAAGPPAPPRPGPL